MSDTPLAVAQDRAVLKALLLLQQRIDVLEKKVLELKVFNDHLPKHLRSR